jgi:hypothetical protein
MSSILEDRSFKNILINILGCIWFVGSPSSIGLFIYFYKHYSWDNPFTIIFFIILAQYCLIVFCLSCISFLRWIKCINFE